MITRRAWTASVVALATMTSLGMVGTASAAPLTFPTVATIPVGNFPTGIDVDPTLQTAYVTDETTQKGDTLAVIDTATNAVTTTIPITPAGTVVVLRSTDTVYAGSNVINENTNQVTGTLGASLIPVLANDGANEVYALGPTGNIVSVIRGTKVVGTVTLPANALDFALDAGLHRLYALTSAGLVVVDTRTLQVTATVPMPTGIQKVAVDTATHNIFVLVHDGLSQVDVFDPTTFAQTSFVSLPTLGSIYSLVVDSTRHYVYAIDTQYATATVINEKSDTVIGAAPGDRFSGNVIAATVNQKTGSLYLVNYYDDNVSVDTPSK